jgi:hypothetical protein
MVSGRSPVSPGEAVHGWCGSAPLAAGFLVSAASSPIPASEPPPVDFTAKLRDGQCLMGLMMLVIVIAHLLATHGYKSAAVLKLYASVVSVVYRGITLRQLPSSSFMRALTPLCFLLAAAGPFSWLVAKPDQSDGDRHDRASPRPIVVP